MIYTATFYGRQKNAIGISYRITTLVGGLNEERARLNLYERFESIHNLQLVERPQTIARQLTNLSKLRRAGQQEYMERMSKRFCGRYYITESYGGGTRYHCPKCDVRSNEYGIPMVSWTNGHATRRFCTKNPLNISTK